MASIRLAVPLAAVAFCAALVPHIVRGADLLADLAIDQVTVYPSSAVVRRRGNVSMPAGEHRLRIADLPSPLNPARLSVNVESVDVRIGGVEVRQIVTTELIGEPERALRQQLQVLEDQRAAIDDEVQTARTELQLLDALAGAPAGDNGNVSGAWLGDLLAAIGTGSADARARVRDANARLRNLDRDVEAVRTELEKVATGRTSTTEVVAAVQTDAPLTVPVTIEYVVDDAGWSWHYEARLDSQARRVGLERKAAVLQRSGENWDGVALTVTTAQSRRDVATPAIAPAFVDLWRPRPRERVAPGSSGLVEEVIVTGSFIRQRDAVTAPRLVAEVFATEFLAEYRIPGRVTIAADREPRLFPITVDGFDVELFARSVMYADRLPRLEASLTFSGDVPIQAGRMQMYRDGAFMGFWDAPLLRPGEDVRLPFGVDDAVRIAVYSEPERSRERGIFGRQQVSEHRRRFEVTSHHRQPLTIELIDRVPVSRNAAIKVTGLDGSTPPDDDRLGGMEGVYLWRLDGDPGVTEIVRHYYAVEYPADERIEISDDDG